MQAQRAAAVLYAYIPQGNLFLPEHNAKIVYIARYARDFCTAVWKKNPTQYGHVILRQFLREIRRFFAAEEGIFTEKEVRVRLRKGWRLAMQELWKEKGFWAAVLLCLGGMAAGFPFYQIKMPLAAGSFLGFCETALDSKVVLFLIPIAGVLPVGAVFVRERSSGFLKLYMARTNRMDYVRQKTVQMYGGGFLPFFIAGAGMVALAFLFVYPLELQGDLDWERLRVVMEKLLRISMMGGILGELSGIFGAVFQNYYMAYGMPFVWYYMLVILKERYLPELYTVYPAEWVAGKEYWGSDGSGIWVFLAAFSMVGMLLHGLILWRRVREI